ncbi:MAG: DUF2939 domain-containing protein [Alphaproteobacteria bacterium]|nr:DUF2939 domain-containing protein [Alphaproteobacteria bacterium]MBU2042842.1 DUF2939 domain-containing protein [Alphaproteobacteria bacterium]MBU2125949.1 DUF2939 domain-containing protein [Alphaproteobacteria bacterium]MBU2207584.1 DUF2939 domain-containing protein [Alphaproteobacteria bacterium]MBU2292229.1 DUF2939 domain-containing protein [Alphaproteobacteria bacterium]
MAVFVFFVSPAVAFFGIRSAAEASDAAGLARLIDYPAVRQSLRPQLDGNPAASAPAPTFMEDPIGAVRRQFEQATAPAAPDVDAYLTPAALAALTRGEGRYASQRIEGGLPSPDNTNTGGPLPRPVYWSVNRARMSVADEGGSETIFTFERQGAFEWKLVHIGLPDGAAPARATPPPVPGVGKSGSGGG